MPTLIFPKVDCNCDPEGYFKCGTEEHVLRRIASGNWPHPMTAKQRQWCVQEADSAGEGAWSTTELNKLNDQELADAVLRAWWDYMRSNCQ